jgi:uncharacterized protein HemY
MKNEIDAQEAMTQGALAWNTLHALVDVLREKGILSEGDVKEIVRSGAEMLVDRYGDEDARAELDQTLNELEQQRAVS